MKRLTSLELNIREATLVSLPFLKELSWEELDTSRKKNGPYFVMDVPFSVLMKESDMKLENHCDTIFSVCTERGIPEKEINEKIKKGIPKHMLKYTFAIIEYENNKRTKITPFVVTDFMTFSIPGRNHTSRAIRDALAIDANTNYIETSRSLNVASFAEIVNNILYEHYGCKNISELIRMIQKDNSTQNERKPITYSL